MVDVYIGGAQYNRLDLTLLDSVTFAWGGRDGDVGD